MDNQGQNYDLIIIGGGAAGLAASLYAGRYRLKTLTITKELGGETGTAGIIENYPGIAAIDGFALINTMKEQAEKVGTKIISGEASRLEQHGGCFKVYIGENDFSANTLILAMGAGRKRLNLPNEKELAGKGVHYCITCDSPFYRDKNIAIVGGGDASVKGAMLAARYANKIFLITKNKKLKAEPINLELMKKFGDKIEIIAKARITEIVGRDRLEKIILSTSGRSKTELIVDGLFVEIGVEPNTALAKPLGVKIDRRGYIKTDKLMRTNIEGVFAAGDIVNHFGDFKQDITAAAMGSVAATSAYEHNKIHGNLCYYHMRLLAGGE